MHILIVLSISDAATVDQIREQVTGLRAAGHTVTVRIPFEAVDARHFTREGAPGADLVIAAGGDGTVHHVANGIDEARQAAGAVPPLAVVPLGTGNDFATSVGIPSRVVEAFEVALTGVPTPVDLARVNDRAFVNVSTGGMGAEATDEASENAKNIMGRAAYLVTGARKFVELKPSVARFSTGATDIYSGPFLIFAVGNGPQTGGGNHLTPEADMHDGLLDLCIVKETSRINLLTLLPSLRSGNHLDDASVMYWRVPDLKVEPEGPLTVNADGEKIDASTYTYSVSRGGIELMLPRKPV